ncbi:hypothetical protein Dsin_021677 [Dipteronia sinensis]|uniref:RNase H type-1 domain-containing protein n=1 Tax=Dipteronia sinensis TaxID=43782 RepID=A0AAE0A146_9ROSI|nr:hypothetical protein Dsin_021677 [Dipteronia sinensis]
MRNTVVHGKARVYVDDVIEWAEIYLTDYHQVSVVSACTFGRVAMDVVRASNEVWKPQDLGTYKINCDTDVDEIDCRIGIGIVIRDSTGFVLVSSSKKIVAIYTPQVAEAVAILR